MKPGIKLLNEKSSHFDWFQTSITHFYIKKYLNIILLFFEPMECYMKHTAPMLQKCRFS